MSRQAETPVSPHLMRLMRTRRGEFCARFTSPGFAGQDGQQISIHVTNGVWIGSIGEDGRGEKANGKGKPFESIEEAGEFFLGKMRAPTLKARVKVDEREESYA